MWFGVALAQCARLFVGGGFVLPSFIGGIEELPVHPCRGRTVALDGRMVRRARPITPTMRGTERTNQRIPARKIEEDGTMEGSPILQ